MLEAITDMENVREKPLEDMDVEHFLLRAMSDPTTFTSKLFYADMFRNASIRETILTHFQQLGTRSNHYTVIDIPCGKAPLLNFLSDFITKNTSDVRWFCIDANFQQLQFVENYYRDIISLGADIQLLKNNKNGWVIPDNDFNVLLSLSGPNVFALNIEELLSFFNDAFNKAANESLMILGVTIKRGKELTDSFTNRNEFTREEILACIEESEWLIKCEWGYRIRPSSYDEFYKICDDVGDKEGGKAIKRVSSVIPYQVLCPMLASMDSEFKFSTEIMFELTKRS